MRISHCGKLILLLLKKLSAWIVLQKEQCQMCLSLMSFFFQNVIGMPHEQALEDAKSFFCCKNLICSSASPQTTTQPSEAQVRGTGIGILLGVAAATAIVRNDY